MLVRFFLVSELFPNRKSFLDRVSTGSGSDLVGDQRAIFSNDFDSHRRSGRCRSLYWPHPSAMPDSATGRL